MDHLRTYRWLSLSALLLGAAACSTADRSAAGIAPHRGAASRTPAMIFSSRSASVTRDASIVSSPAVETAMRSRTCLAHSRFAGSAGSVSRAFRNPGAPAATPSDSVAE